MDAGLNAGIPWLSDKNGSLDIICKIELATVIHFSLTVPFMRPVLSSLGQIKLRFTTQIHLTEYDLILGLNDPIISFSAKLYIYPSQKPLLGEIFSSSRQTKIDSAGQIRTCQ